jgi:hypothetical protein
VCNLRQQREVVFLLISLRDQVIRQSWSMKMAGVGLIELKAGFRGVVMTRVGSYGLHRVETRNMRLELNYI